MSSPPIPRVPDEPVPSVQEIAAAATALVPGDGAQRASQPVSAMAGPPAKSTVSPRPVRGTVPSFRTLTETVTLSPTWIVGWGAAVVAMDRRGGAATPVASFATKMSGAPPRGP